MVIIHTTTFNIQIFHILPTEYLYVFVWVSGIKQNSFPQTSLNDWFSITQMNCIYCAVKLEFLKKIQINLGLLNG